jgi:hypothetical protein
MPLIALSVQNTVSAQETANYQRNHSLSRLKANVPSAFNPFTRGHLSNVIGDAAGRHIRASLTPPSRPGVDRRMSSC